MAELAIFLIRGRLQESPWSPVGGVVFLAVSRRQTGVRQRISGIHLRQYYGGQDAGNTYLTPGLRRRPSIQKARVKARVNEQLTEDQVTNLRERIEQHRHEALAFLCDFIFPFDNNLARRTIRNDERGK